MSILLSAEMEVDGDLKVVGNVQVGTIDSLEQEIVDLKLIIAQLQAQIALLESQMALVGGDLGYADCNGVVGGSAVIDNCGTCDNNPSNDCVQDCFGVWGGTGEYDECEVIDIEGNTYEGIAIGNQVWMAENLKVTKYNNNLDIATGHDEDEWSELSTGAYSLLTHGGDGCDGDCFPEYGYLYNWYAVNDDRGLCMEGWHVPSDEEWSIMIDYLGGSEISGGKLKETGIEYWLTPNTGATNETGFTARPAGSRSVNGNYYGGREGTSFWSSTLSNNRPLKRRLEFDSDDTIKEDSTPTNGWSVRCIKD